jgi:hypothetical protein
MTEDDVRVEAAGVAALGCAHGQSITLLGSCTILALHVILPDGCEVGVQPQKRPAPPDDGAIG